MMKIYLSTIPILLAITTILLSGCQSAIKPGVTSTPSDPTNAYLMQLDLNKIMDRGSDYASIASVQVDANTLVQGLFEKYKDVDRQRVLKEVFRQLTVKAKNETEKEKAVLYFVQKLSVHDFNNPLMGIPIFDPLILFEINAMDCQKDSRMIADIYSAASYESRLVDMYGHMVAEVKYDGDWHYADADMFGGGQVVTMPDGHIPSMAELSMNYQRLDQRQVYLENEVLFSYQSNGGKGGSSRTTWVYPSYAYFSKDYYAKTPGYPYYLYKVNLNPVIDASMFFGWDESKGDVKREHATDIVLSDIKETDTPDAPTITNVSVSGSSVKISFTDEAQSEISGYKVFISANSRGWDYGSFKGETAAKQFWANSKGWQPAMDDSLFKLPPHEVAELDTPTSGITANNLAKGRYYISIMAVDRYGDSIGKTLYPLSNEIVVDVSG